MKVEVSGRHPSRRVEPQKVRDIVLKCALKVLPADSTVSVAFLSDREMVGINEFYTGRIGTTDVLSFALGREKHDGNWSGEILISLDRAHSQAKSKNVSLMNEVVRLLIHAIVHLGGYDHHTPQRFKKMREIEFGMLIKCLSV